MQIQKVTRLVHIKPPNQTHGARARNVCDGVYILHILHTIFVTAISIDIQFISIPYNIFQIGKKVLLLKLLNATIIECSIPELFTGFLPGHSIPLGWYVLSEELIEIPVLHVLNTHGLRFITSTHTQNTHNVRILQLCHQPDLLLEIPPGKRDFYVIVNSFKLSQIVLMLINILQRNVIYGNSCLCFLHKIQKAIGLT